MADDPKARNLTLNYAGGSLTMAVGTLESLFGEDAEILTPVPETETVTVKSHSRTRVIGQPASNVSGYSYENIQWPTSQANNAAAGEAVLFTWDDSDGSWTGRVSGALSALGVFLAANATKTVVFRSERGTKYGPFKKGT
jgi:hypothetical protein